MTWSDLTDATALGGVNGWACSPWIVIGAGVVCAIVAVILGVKGAMRAAERDMERR